MLMVVIIILYFTWIVMAMFAPEIGFHALPPIRNGPPEPDEDWRCIHPWVAADLPEDDPGHVDLAELGEEGVDEWFDWRHTHFADECTGTQLSYEFLGILWRFNYRTIVITSGFNLALFLVAYYWRMYRYPWNSPILHNYVPIILEDSDDRKPPKEPPDRGDEEMPELPRQAA